MSLLGIKIADERVTAAVYDIEGRLLARGREQYEPDHPQPGVVEIDMEKVWDGLRSAVGKAVAGTSDPVTAMSLAVGEEAAVAVDDTGAALAPSVLSADMRTAELARDFQERVSPIEVMRLTGMPAGPTYLLLKFLWLKENRPEVYAATWKFMGWQEYIVNRLGLEPATDPSLAGRTQMFDVINGVWADGIIDEAGLERGKLSEVRPAGTALGEISRKTAEELGLPTGTKFVLGGYDRAVGALGVGAAASGHALNETEGVEYLVSALNQPVVDPDMMKSGFACCPHVVPEMYVSVAYNFTGIALLGWFHDLLGRERTEGAQRESRDLLDMIEQEMNEKPTDVLILPYFTGSGTPYLDPKPLGSIVGLTLDTDRGTVIRALLEGLAFEMKLNVELLAGSGVRLGEIDVTGPAADSRRWCQLKADVLGVPAHRHVGVDAAALGAAMLAGVGTGVYDNATVAVEFCVNAEERVAPSGQRTDLYQRKFARYRKLYPALREIMT